MSENGINPKPETTSNDLIDYRMSFYRLITACQSVVPIDRAMRPPDGHAARWRASGMYSGAVQYSRLPLLKTGMNDCTPSKK